MPNNHAPRGFHSVQPYLNVPDAAKMIAFLKQVFDAEEIRQWANPDGVFIHAEVRVGDTILEVSPGDERYPPRQNTMHVFVDDTDSRYKRALAAGATSLYEPADMPYGERGAGIADPFGNHWFIATFVLGEGNGYI